MAKLIIAAMYPDEGVYEKTKDILVKKFGNIKKELPEYKFNFTDYYEKEMGKNLKKRFIVFSKPITQKQLVDIKIKTDRIEKQLSTPRKLQSNFRGFKNRRFLNAGKRTINLDPGYLTKKELVLASWKQKPFKYNAGKNVYYHKVLEFKNNKAMIFNHTFKDYRLKKRWFLKIR